jgi:hypothetical protein
MHGMAVDTTEAMGITVAGDITAAGATMDTGDTVTAGVATVMVGVV